LRLYQKNPFNPVIASARCEAISALKQEIILMKKLRFETRTGDGAGLTN
jgi:hypothetical protein